MNKQIMPSGRAAMELGSRMGRLGAIAVGAAGETAWMLARCAGCGAALSGGDVRFHDGSTPATGMWLTRRGRLAAGAFFLEQGGAVRLLLWGGDGRALDQTALPPATDWAGTPGAWDRLCGVDDAYAADAAGEYRADGVTVTVMGAPDQRPLRLCLARMGCKVLDRPQSGVPLLFADPEGQRLTVREGLREYSPAGRDALEAAAAWSSAQNRFLQAVPAFGPGEQKHSL